MTWTMALAVVIIAVAIYFLVKGFDVRLAGIRTAPEPRSAAPETTYLGAEAHLMFLLGVGGRVGWFRRASPYSGTKTYDNVGSFRVSIGL